MPTGVEPCSARRSSPCRLTTARKKKSRSLTGVLRSLHFAAPLICGLIVAWNVSLSLLFLFFIFQDLFLTNFTPLFAQFAEKPLP